MNFHLLPASPREQEFCCLVLPPASITPASRHRIGFGLAVCALLAAGCGSSTYKVKVDSISQPAAMEAQSYRLKSKDPRLGEESLRYREAAEYVRTALSGKGLYEAPDEEQADMIVELEYGLEVPHSQVKSVSVPVYAQVGGSVRYETVPVTDAQGVTTTRTVAVYEKPRSELVNYDQIMLPVEIYEKFLRLTARENKPAVEGQPPAELWSVEVSAQDDSKDLRKYLPVLASASIDYIGKDAPTGETVKVKEDSAGVEFVKRGMGEKAPTLTVKSSVAPKT